MASLSLHSAATSVGSPSLGEPVKRRNLAIHSFADWSTRPAPEWLVPNFLPERAVGSVVSPPGGLKSWLLATISFMGADGADWRGAPLSPFASVYAAENPGSHSRRHAMMMRGRGFSGRGAFLMPDPIDLLAADTFDLLADAAKRAEDESGMPCRLMIVDTLRDAWSGDEDSSTDSARAMRPMKRLRDEIGVTIAYAHHCGHGGERERGSSNWRGNADFAWFLDKIGETVTARCLKMRDGPDDLSFAFRLAETETGDAYLEFVDDERAARTGRKLSPQRQLALDALLSVIAERGALPPPSSLLPSSVRGVSCEAWREEFYARLGDTDTGTKRQAFNRALRDLQGVGVVQVREDFAWAA